MKTFALPLAALAMLAGCGSKPDGSAVDATASGTAAAPTPSETASPAPTPSPIATAIPAAVQGRWGLVAADCEPGRDDAKGLLTIDATTLKFYESRGVLGQVKEASDTRMRAAFAFSGEGMNWQRDELLDVQNGGLTLIRREYGDDAAPGPFRYSKCNEGN